MTLDPYPVLLHTNEQIKFLDAMASKHLAPEKAMEPTQVNATKPERVMLGPLTAKSEPNTPIYATIPTTAEAPNDWFTDISYREYLAVMTMEHIPFILHERAKDHTITTPTQFFTPRLLPLLDRMKFYFSRAMALARHEAVNGVFNLRGVPGTKYRDLEPIYEDDIMSSLHVEAFLAGIEEVKSSEEGERVVFRRYWRILEAPANCIPKLGGVVSAGSRLRHHVKEGVHKIMQENWDKTPKVLIAEFTVAPDGRSIAGRLYRHY